MTDSTLLRAGALQAADASATTVSDWASAIAFRSRRQCADVLRWADYYSSKSLLCLKPDVLAPREAALHGMGIMQLGPCRAQASELPQLKLDLVRGADQTLCRQLPALASRMSWTAIMVDGYAQRSQW